MQNLQYEPLRLFFENLQDKYQEKTGLIFSLGDWLTEAAGCASNITFTTHAVKVSNPLAGSASDPADVTPILNQNPFKCDGYLHTANTSTALDIETNARYLPIAKFLMLTLSDGRTMRDHIQNGSDTAKSLFNSCEEPAQILNQFQDGLTQSSGSTHSTSKYLPQVYFPVKKDGYHLLTILTPSSLLFEMKSRIAQNRHAEQTKLSRTAHYAGQAGQPYSSYYDLTEIGYGGTQPQNASFLNSKNAGTAYLINAAPPSSKLSHEVPYTDFFKDHAKIPTYLLRSFHHMCQASRYVTDIEQWRATSIDNMLDFLIVKAFDCQSAPEGWSLKKDIPDYQSIVLDSANRSLSKSALITFASASVSWILKSYSSLFADEAMEFGPTEIEYITTRAEVAMKEAFL